MWFKVDDSIAFHPKVRQAGTCAMGMWLRSGAFAAQNLTDGYVPRGIVLSIGTTRQAQALVEAGLWLPVEGGWVFHDWAEYQPSRAEVEEKRRRGAERLRKWRAENRDPGEEDDEPP